MFFYVKCLSEVGSHFRLIYKTKYTVHKNIIILLVVHDDDNYFNHHEKERKKERKKERTDIIL